MNYNDFTYYRANPYARQGYMPPIAHVNRHKPDFMTELPMGQQHLNRIGKKQYSHGVQRSNIQSQSILKSPQRYPYENRIAFQKTYQRNLNTIDIEGASSGTMMSQAVKNKFKAREQLIRRQKQTGSSHFQQLQHLENTQEQKRRQIAYQQYLRNQQIQQLNSGRLYKPPNYQSMPSNEGIAYRNGIQYGKNQGLEVSQSQNFHKQREQQNYRQQQRNTRTPQRASDPQLMPRYQSIDIGRASSNPQGDQYEIQTKPRPSNGFINEMQVSQSQVFDYQKDNGGMSSSRIDQDRMKNIDRRQFRQQNPTVLSSENSIYLAGRNLIGN